MTKDVLVAFVGSSTKKSKRPSIQVLTVISVALDCERAFYILYRCRHKSRLPQKGSRSIREVCEKYPEKVHNLFINLALAEASHSVG